MERRDDADAANSSQSSDSGRRRFLSNAGAVLGGSVLGGSIFSNVTAASSTVEGSVSGVPCWTAQDLGGGDSTNIGWGIDEWDDWDGCSPIAASMVLGYHENVSESNGSRRESLIDRLHINMDTSNDGTSDPIDLGDISPPFDDAILQPICDGIEAYSAGSNSYSAQQHLTVDAELVLEEIDNNNRPFMLNMLNGGRAKDYPSSKKAYGNHSVAVVGYTWSGGATVDELVIHDGWSNPQPHVIEWGNWSEYSIITVSD
ncbi:C39 family peptidase [Haloarchaeobius sp. DFWS5]|uniref:C39 family peptidase n=1 Tax=Haloarchaeobius sp. DFWS5 TaxID=3446114 RepID=UPI003EB79458